MYLIKGNYHFFCLGEETGPFGWTTYWDLLCVWCRYLLLQNNNQHECGSCLFSERFTLLLYRDSSCCEGTTQKLAGRLNFMQFEYFWRYFRKQVQRIFNVFPGRKWDFYVGAIGVNFNWGLMPNSSCNSILVRSYSKFPSRITRQSFNWIVFDLLLGFICKNLIYWNIRRYSSTESSTGIIQGTFLGTFNEPCALFITIGSEKRKNHFITHIYLDST